MTRIGITGHRFLSEIKKINQGIDTGLTQIETSYPQPFTIISSLAEGADQRVVQRALKRWPNSPLIVPLPLPISIYRDQLTSREGRRVFDQLLPLASQVLPPPETFNLPKAYLLAGQLMLEMSDILIAIWDGQPVQGVGGTGQIVASAREKGLPIVWVHAGNRQPGTTLPTSLGSDQGKVSFEGFIGA